MRFYAVTMHETVDKRSPVVALFPELPVVVGPIIEALERAQALRGPVGGVAVGPRIENAFSEAGLGVRALELLPALLARQVDAGGPGELSRYVGGLVLSVQLLEVP